MMFKNDFVAVVKANGQILREKDSTVFIPFGSEYSIFMKNLRNRKAVVNVSIDGEDVLNGRQLIIDANSTLNLERFLEDNMDHGNRFKFIQKTDKIQEHRGDKIDDGIVRVSFQYEKELPQTTFTSFRYDDSRPYEVLRGSMTPKSLDTSYSVSCNNVSEDSLSFKPLADEGITVKGSESDQSFKQGFVGLLETEKHVITLQLKGEMQSGVPVAAPLTVKSKIQCATCGEQNESTSKYCVECGTFIG